MDNFWSFFIRKKVFSYLVMVALVVFGLFSVATIPKESSPEVTVPIGVVSTSLFGASAADMENLVTNKLEEGIKNNVNNIKNLTSTSAEGGSGIVVEFDASADVDESIQELKDEVDKLKGNLPNDATDPFVYAIDFANDPILNFTLSSDLPEKVFVGVASSLQDRVKAVSGVSDVTVGGLRNREVQVIVSKEKLSQFGLNITDVISSISATNNTLPAGAITISDIKYNVQFEGDIKDPSEIADIAILSKAGRPIYVRDIATVIDGFQNRTSLTRTSFNGEPSRSSLSFNVTKKAGGDITSITAEITALLEELKKPGELLYGMETLITFDSGKFLLKDLRDLTRTGIQTIILVMLVLYASVGWREAIVAGSAIPLSFLIAFILLKATGNTLNFVSLFSLILAIGILVDSGIVIVEGINVRLHTHKSKIEAAKATIREFSTPLTSGTMTTIAVFAPLFFISGITGEFIKSIPFTVISVLLASLLVALGFIPLLGSTILKEHTGTTRLGSRQKKYTDSLTKFYRKQLCYIVETRQHENIFLAVIAGLIFFSIALPIKGVIMGIVQGVIMALIVYRLFRDKLNAVLRFVLITLAVIIVPVVSYVISPSFGAVQVEFFGGGDQDFLIVEIELPEGTVLSATDLESRKIEEILYNQEDIESFTMTVGGGSAFTQGGSNTKLANAFILLDEDRKTTSEEVGTKLREELSAINSSIVRVTELSDGPPVGTPVVITFFGENLEELEKVAEAAGSLLREIPGTTDIVTSTKDDGTEFVLTIDKARATELGLNSFIVSQTLRASISGVEATTINSIEDDVDVIVKLDLNQNFGAPHDTNRTNLDSINQIEIQTQNGPVLLGSILESNVAKGKTTISHEDAKRRATVGAELTATGNTREIISEFKKLSKERNLVPDDIEIVYGGENEETDQSFAEMGIAFIVGVVLMFAILVLQFNSLRYAVFIISVIPTSFVGIFIGLFLTGQALSFPSLMGLIALSGIVVNNAIILIDTINHRREKYPEKTITDVVVEGSISRLRPILLTSITTIVGIAPLTMASALWAPLAWSVMFGLMFTSVATLILIPILYTRKPGVLEKS